MRDRHSLADRLGDKVRFGAQARCIDRDRVVALRDRGVASAVPAHGSAERHVQVDRGRLLGRAPTSASSDSPLRRQPAKNAGPWDSWCSAAACPARRIAPGPIASAFLLPPPDQLPDSGRKDFALAQSTANRRDGYVRRSSFVTFRTTDVATDWEGSATSLKPRLAGGTPAAQPPDLGSRMKSVI